MKYLVLLGFFTFSSFMLIGQSFSANEEIPCTEITIGCRIVKGGEFFIQDQGEYQQLLSDRSPHPDCGSYELPFIDFNKYALIGYINGVGGCKLPSYKENIIRNSNGSILVDVDIVQKGACKRGNVVEFWCLIPKQAKGVEVNFSTSVVIEKL